MNSSRVNEAAHDNYPLTPAKVLKLKMHHLTQYERTEILDFPEIFYIGEGVKKIKPIMNEQESAAAALSRRSSNDDDINFGFDDSKGNYRVTVKDHIAYRYEIVDFLGKGSFGIALKCYDHKNKEHVALKIIKNKKKYYY
jgi:dual specificity tyrosine-phosphorylation-regulated kinase 2/3/4